jgi:hypothetical protein
MDNGRPLAGGFMSMKMSIQQEHAAMEECGS